MIPKASQIMMLHKQIPEFVTSTGAHNTPPKLNKVKNMPGTLDTGLKSGDPGCIFTSLSTLCNY